MNQLETNQLAAKFLLERAMQVNTQSCANMLIDTAYSLDGTIDTVLLKDLWLEKWLLKNASRPVSVTK